MGGVDGWRLTVDAANIADRKFWTFSEIRAKNIVETKSDKKQFQKQKQNINDFYQIRNFIWS